MQHQARLSGPQQSVERPKAGVHHIGRVVDAPGCGMGHEDVDVTAGHAGGEEQPRHPAEHLLIGVLMLAHRLVSRASPQPGD